MKKFFFGLPILLVAFFLFSNNFVYAQTNGVCGTNDGGIFSSLASDDPNNCLVGDVDTFGYNGGNPTSWTWTCLATGGGIMDYCNALETAINGVCGSNNGIYIQHLYYDDPNNCSGGEVNNFQYDSFTFIANWDCTGKNGGTTSQCVTIPALTTSTMASSIGNLGGNFVGSVGGIIENSITKILLILACLIGLGILIWYVRKLLGTGKKVGLAFPLTPVERNKRIYAEVARSGGATGEQVLKVYENNSWKRW